MDSMAAEVSVDPVEVMYVEAKGGLAGVGQAWSDLHSRLSDLRGRKFYGAYLPREGAYRACLAVIDETEPNRLGLPVWTIPGGRYARRKLADWSTRVEKIGEAFELMAAEHEYDPGRWSIEFYRSEKEVVLLLPIL